MANVDDRIAWASSPGSCSVPLGKIVKVEAGQSLELVFLSEEDLPVDTHFWCGRTLPCLKPPLLCPVPHRETTLRKQYWYGVQPAGTPDLQFLCVTQGAYDQAPFLKLKRGSLRGTTVTTWRPGHSSRGKMGIRLDPFKEQPRKLLPVPDVVEFLRRLWYLPLLEAQQRHDQEVKAAHETGKLLHEVGQRRPREITRGIGEMP